MRGSQRSLMMTPQIARICLLLATLVLPFASFLDAKSTSYTTPESDSLAGQLLVAAPDMPDPRFTETVIFMVRHDERGAFGLVVNRVLGSGSIAELLDAAGSDVEGVTGDITIHYGGPVEPEYGFVLHTADYADENTIKVDEHYALTADTRILRAIATEKGPRLSLFAFGYAGWGPGQLERELQGEGWYVAPSDEQIIFDKDLGTKWNRAMKRRMIAI